MHSPTHLYNGNGLTCWCHLVVLLQLVPCYFSLLWQAFTMGSVSKATPIQFINGKSRIKKWRGHKASLSGYYECLSRGLLLLASETDTHKHIHQHSQTKQFQETRHTRACSLRVPGLKIIIKIINSQKICVVWYGLNIYTLHAYLHT